MKEFIEVGKKLPKEGCLVDIKLNNETIIKRVLFSEGRFWKKRIGKNAGQTWNAVSWIYIEKESININIPKEEENDRKSKN